MQLTKDQPAATQSYLKAQGLLQPEETLAGTTKAGEGNMNVTLLVTTNQRRFILKQARPYVAKFPDIPAPIERIDVEHRYLQATNDDPALAYHHPKVLHYDKANHTLLLEYLAEARDATYVYNKDGDFTKAQLRELLRYLSALHRLSVSDFPPNRELRQLNHAHIFDLPFRPDNGFPLDDLFPALAGVARPYQNDDALRNKVKQLGERYLADGRQLIHGDFYPGSFMTRGEEVFVIDGEFAHRGLPEFDLGVLMAHLLLAKSEPERLAQLDKDYAKPATFDAKLTRQFCYVEVMRRLIGIAQLPLDLTLPERQSLLEQARLGLLS